jgi:uncharacterized Tic20 family protein
VLAVVLVGFVFIIAASLVQLAALVFAIVGALRASATGGYRYPLTVRLVK